jgi:pimeloyl-ACP methyl ester carboxylesterase
MLERAKSMATAAKYLWPLPNRGLNRRLHRVSAPTLVVWGEGDGVMSTAYGQAFVQQLADASLRVVAHAGHLPHEEQPEQVADLTLRFIADDSRAAGSAQHGDALAVGTASP